MDFGRNFKSIAGSFAKGRIPCVVIGGVAVNFYRYNRQTSDIDFLLSKKNHPEAAKALEKLGYRLLHQQDTFAQYGAEDKDLIDIDLMFVDQDTLEEIMKDARELKVGDDIFLVPSLMNLIALKLHSSKGSKFRELKDLLDVVLLVKMNKIDPASSSFRELCLKYGDEDLYRRIIEHLPGDRP